MGRQSRRAEAWSQEQGRSAYGAWGASSEADDAVPPGPSGALSEFSSSPPASLAFTVLGLTNERAATSPQDAAVAARRKRTLTPLGPWRSDDGSPRGSGVSRSDPARFTPDRPDDPELER